jgi:hypothetical protein
MRTHWAACVLACALIATFPARLVAQTPASAPTPASTPTLAPADDPAKWGPYVRLAGQAMTGSSDPAVFRVRWRWETPGEVLLEEWCRGSADFDKPSYTTTLRLGVQPGTIMMKTSTMLGKEWVGTLQGDGSVSYVGKGLLKMPFTIRVDEQGMYEMTANKGKYLEKYSPITDSATPVAVAEASSSTSPPAAASMSTPVATVPTAPVPSEKPAPVVARQEPSPPPPPVKLPRQLSVADLDRIHQSVQKSRARSIEQARQAQLQQQESARQLALQMQAMEAAEAQRLAEEAEADAEFEAERAQKAAAWQQMTQANEQALANSMQRLRNTTAQVQAQQAEAQARQRAQADALAQSERRRQVELIRQANQRQEEEAARLAAQRQQYEQQRADAQAAESARQQQQRSAGSAGGAGHASTDTDANRCVSGADVRENDTTKGNTAAYVSNGCGTPVDVKICLMTDSGWKCGVTWGLGAQGSWSYSAFHATGAVFVDAKTAGSSRALASPN